MILNQIKTKEMLQPYRAKTGFQELRTFTRAESERARLAAHELIKEVRELLLLRTHALPFTICRVGTSGKRNTMICHDDGVLELDYQIVLREDGELISAKDLWLILEGIFFQLFQENYNPFIPHQAQIKLGKTNSEFVIFIYDTPDRIKLRWIILFSLISYDEDGDSAILKNIGEYGKDSFIWKKLEDGHQYAYDTYKDLSRKVQILVCQQIKQRKLHDQEGKTTFELFLEVMRTYL